MTPAGSNWQVPPQVNADEIKLVRTKTSGSLAKLLGVSGTVTASGKSLADKVRAQAAHIRNRAAALLGTMGAHCVRCSRVCREDTRAKGIGKPWPVWLTLDHSPLSHAPPHVRPHPTP